MSAGTGTRPLVIVGGGKAGGIAAATLRDEGFNGPVVLVSREPGVPFGRPPLSKTYLRSEEDLTDWYIRPPDWYKANDVDLRADSVVVVDPAAHALALGSGRELGYEKLLIATGGRNRRLQLPGAELPGILLPANGGRVRRHQARSRVRTACGSGGHGVHRLRGGGIPDPAGRAGHWRLSRPEPAGTGPGRTARRPHR